MFRAGLFLASAVFSHMQRWPRTLVFTPTIFFASSRLQSTAQSSLRSSCRCRCRAAERHHGKWRSVTWWMLLGCVMWLSAAVSLPWIGRWSCAGSPHGCVIFMRTGLIMRHQGQRLAQWSAISQQCKDPHPQKIRVGRSCALALENLPTGFLITAMRPS